MTTSFVLKGNIAWAEDPQRVLHVPDGYLVCENGLCAGVFAELLEKYRPLPLTDYGRRLIIPGLYDLHLHAPQFAFRGLGMDLELIDWLQACAYPEEAKYADLTYAQHAYAAFTDALKHSFTARFCCLATMHMPATLLLSELLETTGLYGYVGKLSMDRNAPEALCEPSPEIAAQDCEDWIVEMRRRFDHIKPIISPRFIPSCTDELMWRLQALMERYGVPVQSHLSENRDEIAWVKELAPEIGNYAIAYDRFGMLGENAVMAHAVYPEDAEITLLKERRTMIAHCPACNMNLHSGIAPLRKLLKAGMRVGLGSDVAGGESIDMLRTAADAIQVSKLYWRLIDQGDPALTFPEAFHMATKSGGSFFGKAGSFEAGYMLDALVLDDSALHMPWELSVPERLERALYLSGDLKVVQKYVNGAPILEG